MTKASLILSYITLLQSHVTLALCIKGYGIANDMPIIRVKGKNKQSILYSMQILKGCNKFFLQE